MHRICHVQETPGDVEAVVLKLTSAEHDELHRGPKEFVIKYKQRIFGMDVKKVVLCPDSHPEAASTASASTSAPSDLTETWMLLITHRPACTCVGTCSPLKES